MLSTQKSHAMLVLLFACIVASLQNLSAASRATREQMAKRAAESEDLWKAPASNYNAICSVVIRPGLLDFKELLRRLEPVLAKAETKYDTAALNYLIGETHYWGARTEFRRTRDKSVILEAGDNVAKAFLGAWDAITAAENGRATVQLRRTITSRFNMLLSTSVCGGNLSTNVKEEVIARYIDKLDASGPNAATWSAAQRARVFSNLGIQERLESKIPREMPTNFQGVCDALKLALNAGVTNEALRFAVHMEKKHEPELAKSPWARRLVFRAYEQSRDPRAVPCLKALAACDPVGWLDLYAYSVRMDPELAQEQRRNYVDEYLRSKYTDAAGKKRKTMSGYRVALERLVAAGDYGMAIEVAEKGLNDRDMWLSDATAFAWRLKGIAHERLGDKEKAAAAYRNASQSAFTIDSENLREIFRKDLERVQTEKKDGGTK